MEFVGINVRDQEPNGRRYVRERRIPYPAGFDEGDRVAALYGLKGTPTSVFITRSCRVMAVAEGAMEAASLREALERLLKAR